MLDFPRTADSLWEEAIKIYPAYAPARIDLAFLAYEWGHFEDAVIQLRELKKINVANDSVRARVQELDSLLTNLNWYPQRGRWTYCASVPLDLLRALIAWGVDSCSRLTPLSPPKVADNFGGRSEQI